MTCLASPDSDRAVELNCWFRRSHSDNPGEACGSESVEWDDSKGSVSGAANNLMISALLV